MPAHAASGGGRRLLSDGFWDNMPRGRRYRRPRCRPLAELADSMEALLKVAHDAMGAIADEGLGVLGRPTYERRIAEAFAKKLPIPGEEQIAVTIRSLRICGVWVCSVEGIYILTRCPCFRSLAADATEEELKLALDAKLDRLEEAVSRGPN